MRVRTVLVVASVAIGLLVTSACTNVVGLTGYEFVDATTEAGGDDGPRADAPARDGAPGNEAGNVCSGAFSSFPLACASCAESKCCSEAVLCAAVDTTCAQRARTNTCTGSAADAACRNLTRCLKDRCGCF